MKVINFMYLIKNFCLGGEFISNKIQAMNSDVNLRSISDYFNKFWMCLIPELEYFV